MAPLVTLLSTHKYPISLGIHQILSSQSGVVAVGSFAGDTQLSWMLYVLVPIIVTGVCFIVGAVLYYKNRNKFTAFRK